MAIVEIRMDCYQENQQKEWYGGKGHSNRMFIFQKGFFFVDTQFISTLNFILIHSLVLRRAFKQNFNVCANPRINVECDFFDYSPHNQILSANDGEKNVIMTNFPQFTIKINFISASAELQEKECPVSSRF